MKPAYFVADRVGLLIEWRLGFAKTAPTEWSPWFCRLPDLMSSTVDGIDD